MQDLNDLILFTHVVEHGSFSLAASALGLPKSSVSKRIAQLERALGVHLIERTTRKFRVTDIGQEVFAQCKIIRAQIVSAETLVAEAQSEPQGILRISSPPGLCELALSLILPGFIMLVPHAQVQIVVTNERVNLIERRIDVAFRVRDRLDTDSTLRMRTLGKSCQVLVASPQLLNTLKRAPSIENLADFPTVSMLTESVRQTWNLVGPNNIKRACHHYPRIICSEFNILLQSVINAVGIGLLPTHVCRNHLESGEMVRILPEWQSREAIVHMVFAASEGIPPLVRRFIDYVAERMPKVLASAEQISGRELALDTIPIMLPGR